MCKYTTTLQTAVKLSLVSIFHQSCGPKARWYSATFWTAWKQALACCSLAPQTSQRPTSQGLPSWISLWHGTGRHLSLQHSPRLARLSRRCGSLTEHKGNLSCPNHTHHSLTRYLDTQTFREYWIITITIMLFIVCVVCHCCVVHSMHVFYRTRCF